MVIERKLKLAEAKRSQCFLRMQSIYDLIPQLDDHKIVKQFISQAQMIEQLRSEFMQTMDDINMLNLELKPEYAVSYKALDAFDDLYCVVKRKINEIDAHSSSVSSKKADHVHACREESIKIPRIDLPTFDGDIQNFPFFFETFKRVIHENNKLTDSERVHYLFSHLTGKAKSICAGIIPAAENYHIVWEALIAKYHDERALATSYLNQLFSMKPINGPSAFNLEKLIDSFTATISAIKQLKIDNLSDFIFIHFGLKLLDSDTAKSFEMSIRDLKTLPDYEDFIKFVREQVKILYRTSQRPIATAPPAKSDSGRSSGGARTGQNRVPHAYVSTQATSCTMCNSVEHLQLYNCNNFLKLTPNERFSFIKKIQACTNCLNTQHTASKCNSKGTCRKCKGVHHSLLHFDNSSQKFGLKNKEPKTNSSRNYDDNSLASNNSSTTATASPSNSTKEPVCTLSSVGRNRTPTTEVLATAKVLVIGRNGKERLVRCLLDPGSQKHYATSKCCQMLGLSVGRGLLKTVKGIGGATQPVKGSINITFRSRFGSGVKYTIEALVLDEITAQLPTCHINISSANMFDDVPLADDTWSIPGPIDLLIGVNLFADMLLPGKIINQPGLPDALETALGYIVLGDAPASASPTSSVGYLSTCDVNELIKKFWEIEDLGNETVFSYEEKQAEEFFKSTVKRKDDGRYQVALPFKLHPNNLGQSYQTAERRFMALERKLLAQPDLKSLYDAVIKEHLEKSYLSEVSTEQIDDGYYIPHHAVCREDKTTTRLRVVLDASAETTSGFSLNDVLHAGPGLQADLFCILLNLRLFAIAVTADVRQMYLCIDVRPEDRKYQRLLYRFDPKSPVQIYHYNRVAFGLRSSPFLALRTIQQLLSDDGNRFPEAKEIASRDIYMDDIASSIMNETLAMTATNQLIDLFKGGGFILAKWSSNSVNVLNQIPSELHLSQSVAFDDETTLKILGLRWYPSDDVFGFEVKPDDRPCTKRNILSSIARLFDVLGLVAPIILFAKLLIKELWLQRIDWDEIPPDNIVRQWQQFQKELPLISSMRFPRHLGVIETCSVTVLGFADASEKAYGGVVYVYVTMPNNDNGSVQLVCAKSRVAPLKIVSLARLELCACLLLSQLMKKVLDTYTPRYPIDSILAFSDSTVALCWIHSSPHRWQTFVANRVAKIQENLSSSHFFHIKGIDNPSDCLSRGLTPAQLIDHPLWQNGPPWLRLPKHEWPISQFETGDGDAPEAKSVSLVARDFTTKNIIYELSLRFSSWSKYIRTVAYILKFGKRLPRGPVTANDLTIAELKVLHSLQLVYFGQDIANLTANKPCTDTILKLKPYLDNGILRVGGRLTNSNEAYDYKHPVLLPRSDHIVDILIDHYHEQNFHTGPETLMSILRQKYWIVSARRIIRQRIHKCVFCFRTKPRATYPSMADLPALRVNQVEKAFIHTGCDYAGPIFYTPIRRRGVKSQKAYLCLFTCLTTRAIHLEIASDLTTGCFLSAFKRFLARRGPIKFIYSDNGTNFIGAKTYLKEISEFLLNNYKESWERELADNNIVWRLLPPKSPHFGGCWESNVKCVKSHLFRTIGKQILSYEELSTVLTQIEALLNSRPLTVLSSDPSEPTALTPAHFLNVTPLKFLPAVPVIDSSDNLLQRFQLLDKLIQSFWNRWRNEYLHTLQVRQKWNSPSDPVKEGTIVILMQENVSPLYWPLGRIIQVFPGKDGIVRVALVKTKTGVFKRPVVKLCPLPSQ